MSVLRYLANRRYTSGATERGQRSAFDQSARPVSRMLTELTVSATSSGVHHRRHTALGL